MKYVLVTGVSTGIGRAIAQELLKNDYSVIGTVRNESDAKDFKKNYPEKFHHIILDITNDEQVNKSLKNVKDIIGDCYLSAIVNNSGVAIGGPLMHQNIEEIKGQFEVNVFGLLSLTQTLLPLLGAESPQKHKPGKIINISSTNGKISYPFIGAYSATKHALEALSDALRVELNIYGIKVVLIEPGNIDTPIWDKAEKTDLTPYKNTDYIEILKDFKEEIIKIGKNGLPATSVAKVVMKAIKSKNPKTRYVISKQYFTEWLLPRLLPDRWFDYLIAKEIGFTNKNSS